MVLKVHGFVCGWITAPMEAFVEGESGTVSVPVPGYLLEHPKGRAVFDTGLPEGIVADPAGTISKRLAEIYLCETSPEQEIDGRLNALDVDPASVDYVINSHLHFDHCGGNRRIPNARIVVQKREAEEVRKAGAPREAFDPNTMLADRHVLEIEGEHDLFGDGSVVLFPTPGHTAGHQSLKLACDEGATVLAGDCCYFHRTLRDLKLPPFAHDRGEQLRSIERLRALADAGARVIGGHDPAQWPAKGADKGSVRLG